jgi:ssDNA-binding Zn-finger/Zn-ribbon topoisomerase 1
MRLIINIALRVILYGSIIFPILQSIVPGNNVFSSIIAGLLLVVVVVILEARKLTGKLVDKLCSILGVAASSAAAGNDLTGAIASAIAPNETSAECPNCGAQVKLLNGKGKCDSCGTGIG